MNRDRQKEKEDKDKWTNVKSASILLANLSKCVDESIIQFVFNLIRDYLKSDDSKIRDSVILAFGSITETVHYARIKEIIEGALPTLLEMLGDKNIDVRSTVAWALRKLCKHHTDCLIGLQFNNKELLDQFIFTLTKNLSSNKRVVIQLVDCFSQLVTENKRLFFLNNEHINEDCYQTSILSKYYQQILENLLTIAFKNEAFEKENNVALPALFSLNVLILEHPLDCVDIIKEFFPNIVNSLLSLEDKENFKNPEKKNEYVEAICAILASYLTLNIMELNKEQFEYLYNLATKYFIEKGTVFVTGLFLCSKIILCVYKKFPEALNHLLDDFQQYLHLGLCLFQDKVVGGMVLSIISDFIRELGPNFDIKLPHHFDKIMEIADVRINLI